MVTSFDITVEKMRKYCLYSDRCHQDVRSKLIKDQVYGDDLEQVMALLIQEDFLNEERFAKSYVVGKFRQNKWGKRKIEMQLKAKRVSAYCIRKGLAEISDEEYFEVAERLWTKKFELTREANAYKKKQKVTNFMIGKGYEYEVVKEVSQSTGG